MRSTAFLLILFLFTACGQMRFIEIETHNPAEITYPDDVRDVLIVNNAVPQDPQTGYEYTLAGISQDTCRAHADSALFDACRELGRSIVETDYFNDVRLYDDNTRTDTLFLSDVKLTQKQVQALCEETGTDAVISFDRLLFGMKKDVFRMADGFFYGGISIQIQGVIRSYLPSREAPQTTVIVADSVFFEEEAIDLRILDEYLPTPDKALRIAGQYIGAKAYPVFVPHWNRENRWFYTGTSTRWKQASALAADDKWEEAAELWTHFYTNSSGWKAKANAASNLALASELKGELKKALELATEAYDLYNKNAGEDSKYTQYQRLYKETLNRRVQEENKLTIQIGEE